MKPYTRVIGMAPPGEGGTADIVRLGPPRITRQDSQFDTLEELLWLKDIGSLTLGTNRSAATVDSGDRWIVDSVSVQRYLCGHPVARVISRGWASTKPTRWQYRRSVTGDETTFRFSGQAQAISTAFSATLSLGNYNPLQSPGAVWGFTNTIVAAGSFQSTWVPSSSGIIAQSIYVPASSGWYIAERAVEVLADNATCKVTTTWAWWEV